MSATAPILFYSATKDPASIHPPRRARRTAPTNPGDPAPRSARVDPVDLPEKSEPVVAESCPKPGERVDGADRGDEAGRPERPDERELGALIEPHLALLRRVALRILGCPEQAQDAVQEAICALWQAHGRPIEVRGWLVRTVVHRSLHRRRSEGRRRRWEEQAALDQDPFCPICNPADELERRETLAALERALAELSGEHRAVLALRAAGLEYEDIALELGLPVGTIRSRLNRARRSLRDRMGADWTPEAP
ncbi:MAG: sigma-70 family RNA polymerase sigma factor [Myxococcota bacterium]